MLAATLAPTPLLQLFLKAVQMMSSPGSCCYGNARAAAIFRLPGERRLEPASGKIGSNPNDSQAKFPGRNSCCMLPSDETSG